MPAQILPAARAIVRAAAGSAPFDVATVVGAIARAAIATLSDQLFASSAAPPRRSLAPGVLRELGAFAEALRSELH
jgi:hypothetical protein